MTETQLPDYDRMWEEVYGDLQDFGPAHRHMIRLMRGMLAPLRYDSVLDVGVGFGHNLPVLTEGRTLRQLAGVDLSDRAVQYVSGHFDGDFQRLDITTQHLPDAYELVCCALVMEHVLDDQTALANLRAMCSKYLLVTTIGGNLERYRRWEEQVGHVRNYRRGELEHKLTGAGFTVVEIKYWGFPFFSPLARTLQNHMTVSNELSSASRLAARIMYSVFHLNSSRRGDLLVALARAE